MKENQVYFIMDVSGSMDTTKRNMAKGLYDNFTKEYRNVKIIKHTTVATRTDSSIFNDNVGSGGTYLSSGLSFALADSIANGYKDCVFVQVCDGDNWMEDNERFMNTTRHIVDNHKYYYFELLPATYQTTMYHRLIKEFKVGENIAIVKFDTLEEFNDIFGEKLEDYTIYEVEHKISGKRYDFMSPHQLRIEEMVVCDTRHGYTYGKIKKVKTVQMTKEEYGEYAICTFV